MGQEYSSTKKNNVVDTYFSSNLGPPVSVLSQCLVVGGDWVQVNQLKLNPRQDWSDNDGQAAWPRSVWKIHYWWCSTFPCHTNLKLQIFLHLLLYLDLYVAAVTRSTFHEFYLVRTLQTFVRFRSSHHHPCLHNIKARLLQCALRVGVLEYCPEGATGTEHSDLPSDGSDSTRAHTSSPVLAASNFPGAIQGLGFDLLHPKWSGPYMPKELLSSLCPIEIPGCVHTCRHGQQLK